MNVLSLFDGMSCGQQALERVGIKVDNYFASEIDKYAIQVTMANYPNTKQLGSVVNVDGYSLPQIDILIGGSPCQSFSFAGKRKGMSTKDEQEILTLEHYLELKAEGFEFEGQSYLFWEYMRLLKEVKPKYFLLENVMMGERWEKVLSKAIGVKAIMINSALISAQNRQRLYWTNIGLEPQGLFGDLESTIKKPKDKGILLKDILEKNVSDKYFLTEKTVNRINTYNNSERSLDDNGKSLCLAAGYFKQGRDNQLIVHNTMPRSSKTGKGGSEPLSRNDGKTYCLDTGQTNAIEIFNNRRLNETISKHKNDLKHGTLIDSYNQTIHNDKSITISTRVNASHQTHIVDQEILGGDFRYDEGYRWREGGKSGTLCTNADSFAKINSQIRRLTPVECERLQTVKDNYTAHVSDSQRYKMLGNGWTVDVIVHILSYIVSL
jgi:DNA (cytosine-5)-methyltransferase 3A